MISLQIPNMIIAMEIYGVDDQSIYDELYSRYKWLIKHQEKHLLANHYFENLKAIVIASYVFNEERVFERYLKRIKRECTEEVLEDGVHFELSFMYHKLILEDLLLLRRIINADWLNQLINKMISAGVSIENGLDRTPLFNDSGNNVAKPIEALKLACKKELGITPILTQSLNHSGYHKIYDGDLSIVIDSGIIGPKYNPGHGHCDCLSFELFKNNKPLLVNSGTYQYQGDKRLFFRSSRAHNVAVVNNQEQSDCWGEHRVGKRIKKTIGRIDGQLFVGSFINQYGYKYVRNISLFNGVLSVYDSFPNAKKDESVVSFLHLAPGYVYQGNSIKGFGKKYSIKTKDCTVEQIDSIYSSEFGKIEQNKCLLFRWKVDAKKHGYSINLNG